MKKEDKKFIITGQDQWLIDKKITEILKKNEIDSEQELLIQYKIEDDELETIIQEVQERSFFGTKIIKIGAKNWNKCKGESKKRIVKAIEKSNHWIFLIFPNVISSTTKRLFSSNIEIIKTEKVTFVKKRQLINTIFKKNKIVTEPNVVEYISENLANNLMIVEKEVDKIVNYLEVRPQILKQELAQKLINKQESGTIFPLIEGLLENDRKKIIECYQKLSNKETINGLVLLATLQTYLFLLKQTKILMERKTNFTLMMQTIKKSNFFVMNLIKIGKRTNDEKLGHLTKKMYNLEWKLRTSKLNEKTLIEVFLVS